jgi:hypothetical protein
MPPPSIADSLPWTAACFCGTVQEDFAPERKREALVRKQERLAGIVAISQPGAAESPAESSAGAATKLSGDPQPAGNRFAAALRRQDLDDLLKAGASSMKRHYALTGPLAEAEAAEAAAKAAKATRAAEGGTAGKGSAGGSAGGDRSTGGAAT